MIELIHALIPVGIMAVGYLVKIERGVVRLNGSIAHTIRDLEAHKVENHADFQEVRASVAARE